MTIIRYFSCVSVLGLLSAMPDSALAESTSSILLQSNMNAEFFIDGETVGIGKKVYATVDPADAHTIIAKPEGYVSKEEYIEPPYYEGTSFDFYYMIGDKEI
jgi:hypothetical protein